MHYIEFTRVGANLVESFNISGDYNLSVLSRAVPAKATPTKCQKTGFEYVYTLVQQQDKLEITGFADFSRCVL